MRLRPWSNYYKQADYRFITVLEVLRDSIAANQASV